MTKHKLNKIGAKRLNKLADLLENEVSDKDFDMDVFYNEHNKAKTGCGTVGCACGWAASSPKFRGLVLKSYTDTFVHTLNKKVLVYTIEDTKSGNEDFEAAETYFKLNEAQVNWLFQPEYYSNNRKGRRTVISRIRKFVNDNGLIKGKFFDDYSELYEALYG